VRGFTHGLGLATKTDVDDWNKIILVNYTYDK